MKVVAVGLLMMGVGLIADSASAGTYGAPSYIEHDFSDINLDIPDGDTRGVTEMFRIEQRGSISYLQLELHIEHTWIGDLTVTLISPNGTEIVLHDRTGSSRDHIDRTYDIPDVVGERAAGIWRLRVVDYATRDFGVLKAVRFLIETSGNY